MFQAEKVHNPFRYTGEYIDEETGYIYLRARMYDPGVGRFISEDPAKDGLNWYVYAGNNPVMFVDPWGLLRIIDGTAVDKYQLGSGNVNNEVNDYVLTDIQKVQMRLQELGYLDASIDTYGYFGQKTLAAVNKFKEDNGIQNNGTTKGVVGATTWALLGLDFTVIESVDATITNMTMSRGVLRVSRDITNADILTVYSVAEAVRDAYQVAFGEPFNVSVDSIYWELVGHLFADAIAEGRRGGILEPVWERIQKSTGVIDIGNNVIVPDNNRWVWDLMAQATK